MVTIAFTTLEFYIVLASLRWPAGYAALILVHFPQALRVP